MPLPPWLPNTAGKCLANQRRSRQRATALIDRIAAFTSAGTASIEDDLARDAQRRALLRALASLREGDRALLVLRHWDDLAPRDVADIGDLAQLLQRARGGDDKVHLVGESTVRGIATYEVQIDYTIQVLARRPKPGEDPTTLPTQPLKLTRIGYVDKDTFLPVRVVEQWPGRPDVVVDYVEIERLPATPENARLVEVTVQEAKTQLSRLLRRVEAGEDVVIRRGREPVAMLVRIPPRPGKRDIWGDLDGAMAPDFDDMPSDFEPYA